MKILYFAWVRERIGMPEEEIALPAEVSTPADLLAFLSKRGPEYESAFERPEIIRVAVDQTHVDHDMPIGDAREIALFPPMTGG
ncbi:molybdopterin synthase subunit MoaD [Breoghania corrubedonensis]|uniref:Molybdopterin synthase sulfur carrier subunit n=1 Tax=Breoghania corrubedonensis TaxID=665038 RepID=A0A2T5UNW3_9HYPH|nr:molybdopterin converting factor subunit 1 [Breoghania corrubedonensis]PTW53205.1 molybdopterin synthase subunit MoaD [Breoghania corrubedonensis]